MTETSKVPTPSKGPYLGDIRLCFPERDVGKLFSEITDFEVWDGTKWLHASKMATVVYSLGASK